MDELAKRASPAQKWRERGKDSESEITPMRRSKAHGTPASPLTSHLIKKRAVGFLHLGDTWQPQIHQHKESVDRGKKVEKIRSMFAFVF